jgi:regulator of sirC expression with transglutaminase-like and TPR domain
MGYTNTVVSIEELTAQLKDATGQPDSEVELALLVAQIIDPPAQDPAQFKQGIHAALQDLSTQASNLHADPAEAVLQSLQHAGFGQANETQQVVTAQHSHLGWVLENHQGIPISLAVVVIAVARQCGLSARGINFPGHFLVSLEDRLVDPLSLQFVDEAQLLKRGGTAADLARQLQPAGPKSLVLRMLNNLKALQMAQQEWSGALDLIDYQAAICAGDTALLATLEYERGQCWVQLGAYAVAAEAFSRCADKTSEPELARQANERVEQLSRRTEVLH